MCRFWKLTKERTIDLDVKCSITMEDGSELYIIYGGKMIMDEKSDKLNEEGKVLTPKMVSTIGYLHPY